MRIGIFTDSYTPYTSGVVTSILTFKAELNRLGHELFIFAPSYPNSEVENEEGVYRFYSLPSPTNRDFSVAIPVLPGLNMVVKKLDLDLIHVHSPLVMGRVGLRYARKYRLPLAFTYHTLYDQYVHYVPVNQDLAKEIIVKYSNNFCNHCDHIIVPSLEVADILHSQSIKTPISIIPTGVPMPKFCRGDAGWLKRNYPIPAENQVLLFVGRLTKEKNLEFLLQAFKEIKKQRAQTSLVITAQGPLESELKQLTRDLNLVLNQDVVFTGVVPYEALVDVYHSADLFVFSSMTETQGLVLIEAMAAGLPVVAVKAYGVQDMVDHDQNGLLTACDIQEFSNAVRTLLNNPEMYKRFQQNALQKANSLSSENMALKLEALYEEMLLRKMPRRSKRLDFGAWISYWND